jgi:hypothetical protein
MKSFSELYEGKERSSIDAWSIDVRQLRSSIGETIQQEMPGDSRKTNRQALQMIRVLRRGLGKQKLV